MSGRKSRRGNSLLKNKSNPEIKQEEKKPVKPIDPHADSIVQFDSAYILKKTARSSYAEIDMFKHKSTSDLKLPWSPQRDKPSAIFSSGGSDEIKNVTLASKSSYHIPSFETSCSDEISFPQLSQMEAVGVISALETCVNQLHILAHANMKTTVMPDFNYKTLKERFGDRAAKETLIDEELDLPTELGVQLHTLKKINEDCTFLEVVMANTSKELKLNGTYGALSAAVIQEILVNYEEEELLRQQQENNAEVLRLRKMINTEDSNIQNQIHKVDEAIAKLKDAVHDTMVQNDVETRFIDNWEHARADQQNIKFTTCERDLREELAATKISIEMETRVNNEIQDFISEAEESLQYEIERWSVKYTRELEAKTLDLEVVNAQRESHKKKLISLTNLYQERETEIQAYLAIKDKKRAIEAHEQHLNDMATRIEAWWKGVMVRRGLGPYRNKRKGKDKGKKGKGGKKK